MFAVAKWTGLRAKDIRARLGKGENLPEIDEARTSIAGRMTEAVQRFVKDVEQRLELRSAALGAHRTALLERQRKERAGLEKSIAERWKHENTERAKRLNKGLRGKWDRLTGRYQSTIRQTEREALFAFRRDREQKDALVEEHLDKRRELHHY